MKAPIVIIALLASGFFVHSIPDNRAIAVHTTTLTSMVSNDVAHVILWGTPNGWNGTWSTILNPSFVEFRGAPFSVNASWNYNTGGIYDFAIYTAGFPEGDVSTQNSCSLNNTSGCLVRSLTISASLHSSWAVLTPSIPHDDLSGSGQYEYYDEYHPSIGHGKIRVYKSPDLDSNGMVNIIDLAAIALA
jgi:hypothetical protein